VITGYVIMLYQLQMLVCIKYYKNNCIWSNWKEKGA